MLSTTRPLSESLPAHGYRHVAIIMDGNDHWAKKQRKARVLRHKVGAKSVCRAVSFVADDSTDALALYAFSSGNWDRPAQEVSVLMELFVWTLDSGVENLHRHNVRLHIIGDISRSNPHLQERIRKSEVIIAQNTGLTLNIAASYGGWWDIVQEIKQLARQVQSGALHPEQIDGGMSGRQICMHELAPANLVIRTGGEHRIGNFLSWQIAYAELCFTDVLWSGFDEQDFEDTLYAFANHERHLGGTEPGDEKA